jgi:hypothetical protein
MRRIRFNARIFYVYLTMDIIAYQALTPGIFAKIGPRSSSVNTDCDRDLELIMVVSLDYLSGNVYL